MKKQFLFLLSLAVCVSNFASDGRTRGCSIKSWARLACVAGFFCCARGAACIDDNDGESDDRSVKYDRVALYRGKWHCASSDSKTVYMTVAGPLFQNDETDFSQTQLPVSFYTGSCDDRVCGLLVYSDESSLPEAGKAIAAVQKEIRKKRCISEMAQERAGVILPSEHGGWDHEQNFGYPKKISESILSLVAGYAGMDIELLHASQNQTDVVMTLAQRKIMISTVKKGFK